MHISVEKINKKYGEKTVLEDFSADFENEKTTVITGRSGIGKTTLLRLIMGLEHPDSGEVKLYDDSGTEMVKCPRESAKKSPKKSVRFATVFQDNVLCEGFSAIENVLMVSPKLDNDFVIREFEKIGITKEDCEKKVKLMSGGMKRRVAILRALLAEADIYVLDEPIKEMDEKTAETVFNYIREKLKGRTVIYVTHNCNEIIEGDNIIEM